MLWCFIQQCGWSKAFCVIAVVINAFSVLYIWTLRLWHTWAFCLKKVYVQWNIALFSSSNYGSWKWFLAVTLIFSWWENSSTLSFSEGKSFELSDLKSVILTAKPYLPLRGKWVYSVRKFPLNVFFSSSSVEIFFPPQRSVLLFLQSNISPSENFTPQASHPRVLCF